MHFAMIDWAAFSLAMTSIIGAITIATVTIINAIHGLKDSQSNQHSETSHALASIETKVNGNQAAQQETLNRVIDKLPDVSHPKDD